ncbi:DNA-directed RNA polymerase subunit alpha [Streptomyces flaveus]|uniref:DNA-directed RNA polymerase subunit alpha n=19 Tax=Streptomyces TaxID=1883 RepID=A0A917VH40_9ACTN|nr:DNA-directed RNA polymerase subunit alpha [Streptomyces flaveus]
MALPSARQAVFDTSGQKRPWELRGGKGGQKPPRRVGEAGGSACGDRIARTLHGVHGVTQRAPNHWRQYLVLIAQRPSLTEEVVDEFRSRFVIEPLEPGFGYTLGNSLRRTLLSSIPGAAVTSIRIDGVLHEFTTVPGVKEDVTDLILNIKQLVVSSEHDEPVVMYLRKQGPGLVTAADIAPPAGVEVHNPDLVLATLNGKGKLEMELTVERGRGYVSAVQNKQVGQEIGRIPVDSIYSPVLKVTYKVEATRVEQRTDFDKLIVDVETKQAMRPRDAMASAGKTLVELFGLARELNIDAEGIDMGPSPTDAALAADLVLPIEDLDLTVRSYNCLKREGVHSVGELVARSEADLLDIRNFGAKSIDEVKAKLAGMGLGLKDSPPGFDPTAAADAFGANDDADAGFVETEQY